MSPIVKKVSVATAVFFTVFAISLFLWLKIKPFYAEKLVTAGSSITAIIMDARVMGCSPVKKGVEVRMTYYVPVLNELREVEYTDILFTDRYTFNAPLTLALLASLMTVIRMPWRSFLEGCLLISAGHLLWIVSYLATHLKTFTVQAQQFSITSGPDIIAQFLWQFSDNMLIRFEPFIIPATLWIIHRGLSISGETSDKNRQQHESA
jgi:hypothetical protein